MDPENQYADIDALTSKTNKLYEDAYRQQQDIINKQTEMNISDIERKKTELDEEADKTNKALYSEYKRNSNPYGYNAELLATQGLGNSGVSESSRTSMYNTYQNNRTNTLNTATKAKANFDAQIAQARANGDIQLAQSALDLYNQQIDSLYTEYGLRQDKEQFLYQKGRDAISDSRWEREYQHQLDREAIEDARYDKEWAYTTNKASSKSSSGRKSSRSSSNKNYLVANDDETLEKVSEDNSNSTINNIINLARLYPTVSKIPIGTIGSTIGKLLM